MNHKRTTFPAPNKFFFIRATFLILFLSCQNSGLENPETLVNNLHLNHLSETITVENIKMTIVHIYAESPDYRWTEASGEGITCVDDVTRTAIFYLRHLQNSPQPTVLKTVHELLNFILYMQASNGLFYNFMLPDLSINKEHINSEPRAAWWSWRAIWALAEGYQYFEEEFPDFAQTMKTSIERTFPAIDSLLVTYPNTVIEENITLPTWLPYQTAADQAAVIILALVPYYQSTKNQRAKSYIEKLAEGIIVMQLGDSLNFPYNCFLSWRNKWHAYGNSQAYALLRAGEILRNNDYISKALNEIDHFYPFLVSKNYLNEFTLIRISDKYVIEKEKVFEQIAYGFRPLVWACLKAYDLTKDEKYATQAAEISCWLLGKNITGKALYDPLTGRCYDGINDEKNLNKNSGAESTIEALLTLLPVEQNPISKKVVWDFYSKVK